MLPIIEQKTDNLLIKKALEKVYKRGNRTLLGFLCLHMGLAIAFASIHNTWISALLIGGFSIGLFGALMQYLPTQYITRVWAGVALQIFVLLHIFQLKGLAEVRFFFFTSFMILIVYQDIKAMYPSILLFLAQIFALPFIPQVATISVGDTKSFVIYSVVAFLHIGLTSVWAYFLRRNTLKEAEQKYLLIQKQKEIEKHNLELEKTVKYKTMDLVEALENAQSAEEELRQNMEELQTTQDEIETQRQRLLENQVSMMQVQTELRERQLLMERSQWLESNLVHFDDLMREYYDKSLQEFSEAIMLKLAELIKATQGAFYVHDETDNSLYMTAGYACTPETVKKNTFKAGEGLIGQLVKTKKMICLDNLPAESATVQSALTKVHSKTLVLVPLLYNEDIQGVIEIGVLKDIDELHIEFLERLAQNVAAMLQSIRGIMRTQRLLEQSREIAKQLQINALELEKAQEEAEEKASELRNQFEAINHAMVVLEYTAEGNILGVNENFEELSGYEKSELVGKHHSVFLSERYINSEEYRQVWNKIRNNDFVESEYEGIAKDGKTFWLHTNYYAFGEGRNKKIRVLAHDATKEKEQERKIIEQIKILKGNEELMRQQFETLHELQEENEQKTMQLQDQMNALNLSTAVVEYDQHGKVIFANEHFYEIMGYDSPELIGKSHKELVEPRFADSKSYQKFWDRLHTKEFIEGEFEFISKNLNLIWLRGNYYPVTDKRGKLVKIMQLSTDITEEIQQDEKTKNHLLDLEILRSQLMEKNRELEARNAVFVQILPTIEFSPDGEILAVNALFTEKFALPANDLVGKHHKILVDSKQVNSQAYNDFWIQLNKNETATWTHKNGHLAYHPIADATGRVIKILGVLR